MNAPVSDRDIRIAEACYENSKADAARWDRIAATRPLTARERVMSGNAHAELILDYKRVELLNAKKAVGL